ncbi:MAG: hypothetical protein ACI8TX_000690 [Hyphomicrobiaceae bacterium]|jgi:hypothetical protein
MTNTTADLALRINALDSEAIESALLAKGHACVPLLNHVECKLVADLWDQDALFRKHVDMGRHSFGEGQYRYFSAPLPPVIHTMRTSLYEQLAPVANRLDALLGRAPAWPEELDSFTKVCASAGQTKPTPLLLRYQAGGYNRMHRDLYGDLVFPLQATLQLTQHGKDFTGGEFMLLENSARKQALARTIVLERGEMVIFPAAEIPVRGARGWVRGQVRHGVSPVASGQRTTLGLIFHDAA